MKIGVSSYANMLRVRVFRPEMAVDTLQIQLYRKIQKRQGVYGRTSW